MKKTFSALCLVLVMILSCICAAGCSDKDSGGSDSSGTYLDNVLDNIEKADSASVETDAATLDAACKDYYAMCVSGAVPGEGRTKSEIDAFTEKASIKDAFEYANVLSIVGRSFDKLSVDSSGTIFVTGSSSRKASEEKTALLASYTQPGSLKALYQ